jgi:hypothetical protein
VEGQAPDRVRVAFTSKETTCKKMVIVLSTTSSS